MKPRTSITHSLQIAEVSADSGYGRIGLTFCPGKHQPAAATGAWQRDLDLDAVAAWGAVAVVTLIESHEMAALKVERIGAAVAARHMVWYHLLIADVGAPNSGFEQAWTTVGAALRAILRDGFDILVQCKVGPGRAGTITARLMVELATAPSTAIARLIFPSMWAISLSPIFTWQPVVGINAFSGGLRNDYIHGDESAPQMHACLRRIRSQYLCTRSTHAAPACRQIF